MFFKFIIVPIIWGILGCVCMWSAIWCYPLNRYLAAIPVLSLLLIARIIQVFINDQHGNESSFVHRIEGTIQAVITSIVLYMVYVAVLLTK